MSVIHVAFYPPISWESLIFHDDVKRAQKLFSIFNRSPLFSLPSNNLIRNFLLLPPLPPFPSRHLQLTDLIISLVKNYGSLGISVSFVKDITSAQDTCVCLSEIRFIPFSFTHATPHSTLLMILFFLVGTFRRKATNENRENEKSLRLGSGKVARLL
jgi:hypothetical protein